MSSPTFRDALALHRLARIKQRLAIAQAAAARRAADRPQATVQTPPAGLAAAFAEGVQMLRAVCTCVNCQLRRAQLAEEGAETPPESIKAAH